MNRIVKKFYKMASNIDAVSDMSIRTKGFADSLIVSKTVSITLESMNLLMSGSESTHEFIVGEFSDKHLDD